MVEEDNDDLTRQISKVLHGIGKMETTRTVFIAPNDESGIKFSKTVE